MLENKEEELLFSTVKKLFKLLIGAVQIEARFLYNELQIIFGASQDDIFDYLGCLKPDLPYSRTALLYYCNAKSKNKCTPAEMK